MAFRTKKISQMDPKGAPLEATDLLEISELVSGSYVTKSITGAEIIAGAPAAAWGTITGTLSTQTDLQNALNAKVTGNTAITGATKTKVTYDSKGLVTSGADATTADIADSLNKRYVTDANLTTIGNQSGVNTGDQTLAGLGGVPTTRTLTINGTTQDLSADRTFTVSTGITIGTTAITSGVIGRVLFQGTGNVVQQSDNLFWDNTNGRFGVGTSSPAQLLTINGRALIGTATNIGSGAALAALQVSAIGASPIQILSDSTKVFGLTYEYNLAATSFQIFSDYYSGSIEPKLTFGTFTNKTNQLVLNKTGNIGINTTTDAGFKLDINGTLRVSGQLFLTTGVNAISVGGNTNYSQNEISVGLNSFIIRTIAQNRSVSLSSGNTVLLTANFWSGAPSGAIGGVAISDDGAPNVIAGAVLNLSSTTKGFLPPRMTTTQKNAIASPATGLMVYDTTLNLISVYNGTIWISL